jgi:hypothetical protein
MKSLSNYVLENLDIPKKMSKTALKKMATNWIYSHVGARGARYKTVQGDDGIFTVTCDTEKFGSEFHIKMTSDIPDFVRFDVKCYQLNLSGENDNILHYFNRLDVKWCNCSASGSLGEIQDPANDIKIDVMEFENTPRLKPSNLKGVEIAKAKIANAGDYSFLSGLEGINIDVKMDDCGSIQVDFDGLHIGELQVHSETHKENTLTIKGKYELESVDHTWWSVIEGIPSKIESCRVDHLGSVLPQLKQIDTLYWGSVQSFNDYDIEAFEKIISGKIKINTIKHFQAPYPTISMEDFIRRFQINIAMNRGYTGYGKSDWKAHDLDKESFNNWLESQTKYEIVETKEGEDGHYDSVIYYVICDKSSRVPVGIYYGHSRNVYEKLYTNDKNLLMDVI